MTTVELFHTGGCKKCAAQREELKAAAEHVVPGLVWRDIDAAVELDRAVELGVLTLPAVAIDGELAFSSLPTASQLAQALRRRQSQEASDGR